MSPQAVAEPPEQMLRRAGLRVTRPRLAVLAALRDAPHSGADAMLGVVRRDAGPVSTQAVYDVLNVRPAWTPPTTSASSSTRPT
ncbi:MAG: hypothetical protein ABI873_15330 [Marmoricola sp.]